MSKPRKSLHWNCKISNSVIILNDQTRQQSNDHANIIQCYKSYENWVISKSGKQSEKLQKLQNLNIYVENIIKINFEYLRSNN